MSKTYIVVFEGVQVNIPVHERTFNDKDQAKAYKSEHPLGKFAAVMCASGTFGA